MKFAHISNRLTHINLMFLFLLSIKLLLVSCIVLPKPTKTSHLSQTASIASYGTPTALILVKRGEPGDEEDNLDLYQNWASACRNRDNINALVATDQATPTETVDPNNLSINNLWKTVTQTVNCGGGQAVTVTKTVNAEPTCRSFSKSSYRKKKTCEGQCWSDYLWHTYGDNISPAQGFAGIICIIIGLYFSILGYRFFRPTLGLVGFVFFATMTWIGLVNNEPAGGYPLGDLIYICVSAGLGLLGSVFLVFMYPLGVYCLACLGGFYSAVYFLSWQEDLVITIKVARICFIIGISLLGPFLMYFVETYMVFFSTSVIGSYLFYFGLDFFTHTGFINPWLLIFDGNSIQSLGWQYYWHIICLKSPGFGLNPPEEKPEEEEKKEEPAPPAPPGYMCMPPPYSQQPMFMQNICATPPYC